MGVKGNLSKGVNSPFVLKKLSAGLSNAEIMRGERTFKVGMKVNGFKCVGIYPHHTLWQYLKGGWYESFRHNQEPTKYSYEKEEDENE